MSGKLGSSEKQVRDMVQSDCRLSGIRRSPFADITNMLDSRLGRYNWEEPSSPPPQSHTLRVATQNENDSKISSSGRGLASLKNRGINRHSPQPITAPPLGSVPQSRPSRRQVSGAPNQCPRDPGLCGESTVNDVLHYDASSGKPPLSSYPGLSTREPLSTSLLPPKTHKLACGQLAVLPSRSVLVDFREGERRRGKKGEEVMVVSPNGDLIHLFSAPHLSTPCCLAEPFVTYSLNELPVDQYKLYGQAKKVIEHIKRNVTKVVMYEGNFVCTLMANEPRADIEIRTNPRSTTAAISASTTTVIRIRFSRKLRTMQIFSSETSLCKKTMFCTARGIPSDAGDWASLSTNEKECLATLLDFLRVVEAVEGLPRDASASDPLCAVSAERLSKHSTKREAASTVPPTAPPRRESDACFPRANLLKPAGATSMIPLPSSTAPPASTRPTHVTVSPRPRFPSAVLRTSSDTLRKASSTAVGEAPPQPRPLGDPSSSLVTRTEDGGSLRELSQRSRLQTRFMPGVGWCVRSGLARYRIMFADGVALEVDVDEERVEMVERDGSVVRYTVRECSTSREVGDRMKVFRKFLPLFDDE